MHNYKNDYRGKRVDVAPVDEAVDDAVVTTAEDDAAEDTATVETLERVRYGYVCDCKNLRVRKTADASNDRNIVDTISEGSTVIIDEANSTADWVKIDTETGISGFCMRKYIKTES